MRIHRIGQKRTVFVRRFIVEVRLYPGFSLGSRQISSWNM
jgi:hypothetical protein